MREASLTRAESESLSRRILVDMTRFPYQRQPWPDDLAPLPESPPAVPDVATDEYCLGFYPSSAPMQQIAQRMAQQWPAQTHTAPLEMVEDLIRQLQALKE